LRGAAGEHLVGGGRGAEGGGFLFGVGGPEVVGVLGGVRFAEPQAGFQGALELGVVPLEEAVVFLPGALALGFGEVVEEVGLGGGAAAELPGEEGDAFDQAFLEGVFGARCSLNDW
jgi:hypothetical protein